MRILSKLNFALSKMFSWVGWFFRSTPGVATDAISDTAKTEAESGTVPDATLSDVVIDSSAVPSYSLSPEVLTRAKELLRAVPDLSSGRPFEPSDLEQELRLATIDWRQHLAKCREKRQIKKVTAV
jgi:hypothetical protein